MTLPTLLLISEAAQLLSVSKDTVRRWALAGKVPFQKTGNGTLLFTRQDIDKLVRERKYR